MARQQYKGDVLTGPLSVEMIFYKPRAKAHYGTGRNAALLKDSAPAYPAVKPDVLKLARAIEDGLTGVVYADDALIVSEGIAKRYCARGEEERTEVTIRPISVVTVQDLVASGNWHPRARARSSSSFYLSRRSAPRTRQRGGEGRTVCTRPSLTPSPTRTPAAASRFSISATVRGDGLFAIPSFLPSGPRIGCRPCPRSRHRRGRQRSSADRASADARAYGDPWNLLALCVTPSPPSVFSRRDGGRRPARGLRSSGLP